DFPSPMPEASTGAPYLAGLNPEQLEATCHFEGPILVLAGAGSGKTRVLTTRVCHLVREHGVPPSRILAVTFTNKAAGEMRERIAGLLGSAPTGMWVGTFHAIGARLLRRHADRMGWDRSFSIFDADQSLRLVKSVQEAVGLDPRRWNPTAIRAEISNAKNQLVDAAELARRAEGSADLFLRNVSRVFTAYQEALERQNAFDFDDLLTKPVELFETQPELLERYRDRFAFVLVDEYQDTNRAQFRFVELIAGAHGNLMVVGDDDQSIYRWRGADIRNILDFETAFPGAHVVRLERNYRSTQRILDAANRVIAENVRRKGKTLRTERAGGEPVTLLEALDENDEARWIVKELQARVEQTPGMPYRDVAVLYRTNAQARALEDALRREGIPYQVVGSVRFYERREVQDVLAYLRLISNPRDQVAFERVVNYPRRGVGLTTLEHLRSWAGERGLPLLEAAARADEILAVRAQAASGLRSFAELIRRYGVRATQARVGTLLEELVEELDLARHLRDEGPEGEDRARNVAELIAGALDFDAAVLESDEEDVDTFTELDLFLQQVALVADVDRLDPNADAVTLMTLHNAKGLEFPVVFIAGMEEGLFPLARAYDEPDALEEERRLFYVGITRAEDKLSLSWARGRRRAGDFAYNAPSSFLEALPEELLERRRTDRVALASYSTPHRSRRAFEQPEPDFDPDPDFGMNQDVPRFVKGERVVHDTFGSGAVVEISGFGRDLKVTVDFDTVGRKKLLLRYASLEKDWP
ncbi:MAG TPA: UvrD-helicase domain-containing protein, partial [Longimicrobiales bacterium]|nr:UvrD-helicase domain-containing protein [Longimicrobiales bacterium]